MSGRDGLLCPMNIRIGLAPYNCYHVDIVYSQSKTHMPSRLAPYVFQPAGHDFGTSALIPSNFCSAMLFLCWNEVFTLRVCAPRVDLFEKLIGLGSVAAVPCALLTGNALASTLAGACSRCIERRRRTANIQSMSAHLLVGSPGRYRRHAV
jgi:hypothetical protein